MNRRRQYMLYVAFKEWQEDGLLAFDTFTELMDHGIDPEGLVETFNTLKDINDLIDTEDYDGDETE